jgi:outer membrane biosynthesis protein TonB
MRGPFKIIAYLSISFLLHISMLVAGLLASPRFHPAQEPANRAQGRNQQSLPLEKQKSLATYGPEDVFPTQTSERDARKRSKRAGTRPTYAARPAVKPAAIIAPEPTQPTQETNATVDPSPSPSPYPTPSATPAVAVANLSREAPSQQSNSLMSLQNLTFLTLLVSSALIFVLFKLMSKLREGSG